MSKNNLRQYKKIGLYKSSGYKEPKMNNLRKKTDLDAHYYRDHSKAQYNRVQELIPKGCFQKNADILDVGCGDGKITAEIASLVPNGKILGIDASKNMIRLAKETFQLPNLEFQCVKAEDIHILKFFDYILCFNCLLWIRQPKKALKRLANLLKSQGKLIILTYLKDSSYIGFLEKTLENFSEYKNLSATHTMLSEEEHRSILEENNLKIETFEIRNLVSHYVNKEDLKNYLKGWLGSFVPLLEELQNEFLNQAVENSLGFSINSIGDEIHLPYKALIIKATKK